MSQRFYYTRNINSISYKLSENQLVLSENHLVLTDTPYEELEMKPKQNIPMVIGGQQAEACHTTPV